MAGVSSVSLEPSKAAFAFDLSAVGSVGSAGNASKDMEASMQPSMVQSAPVSIQAVAHSFVYQYYTMLHNDPSNLHLFYDEDSQYHRLTEYTGTIPKFWRAYGQQSIYEGFKFFLSKGTTTRIRIIEPQESIDGGIFLFVSGTLTAVNQAEREFVQSIFLGKQKPNREGWYIRNEVFYFVDGNTSEEGETARQLQKDIENSAEVSGSLDRVTGTAQALNDKYGQSVENESNGNKGGGDLNVNPSTIDTLLESYTGKDRYEELSEMVVSEGNIMEYETPKDTLNDKMEPAVATEKILTGDSTAVDAGAPHASSFTVKQWREVDRTADITPDANWPKLGEWAEHKSTEEKTMTEPSFNYHSTSFASKLMKNVNGRQGIQKGYATNVPKKSEVDAQAANVSTAVDAVKSEAVHELVEQQNLDAISGGPTDNKKPLSKPQKEITKKIVVRSLPEDATDEMIKRSIASRLKSFNDGHVIEVKKPVIELDCRQSAEFLFNNGWHFQGEKMSVTYFKVIPRGRDVNDKRSRGNMRSVQTNNGGSDANRYREDGFNKYAPNHSGSGWKPMHTLDGGKNRDEFGGKGTSSYKSNTVVAEQYYDGNANASSRRRRDGNNSYTSHSTTQRLNRSNNSRTNGNIASGSATGIST